MATVIDLDKEMFYVYRHIRNDTGQVFYVGKGRGNRAWSKGGRNFLWQEIAKESGYKIEFVKFNISEDEAFGLEKSTILDIGIENLCNLSIGGGGSSGYKLTEKQREKQRNALIGRKVSEETKRKISASNKGRIASKEKKIRLSLSHIGKIRSAESKIKQSQSMLDRVSRKKNEMYGDMMKPVKCSNGITFPSLADACSWVKSWSAESRPKASISRCALGQAKTAYGFGWSYN